MSQAVPDQLSDHHERTTLMPDDAFNKELVANVHPTTWVNPKPNGRYNLVAVGGGTAGLVSAMGAAGLGARVALIERHLLGGDCLNFGCVPSKSLIRSARSIYDARTASDFGLRSEGTATVDFAAVMARMRRLRSNIAHHDSAQRFADAGIDVFLGSAKFMSRDTVEVNGVQLQFSRAVIATGARAANLPVPGLAEAGYLTNETVFSLTQLPRRFTVIGAGPIGCELAQAFRRFGSEVTILSADPRVLPREDPEAALLLEQQFRMEGIQPLLGARLVKVIAGAGAGAGTRTIVFERGNGLEELEADEVLVAVGRTPNVEGLGLDAAGVTTDRSGVKVDERLRTSNPRIYAAGDICSTYKFTHAADAMARIVIQNSLFMGKKNARSLVIPWSTYTDPEIAHVGIYEAEAAQNNVQVKVFKVQFGDVDRAVLDGETEGFAKLLVDERNGKILGATAVARHAGELIGEMSLAITAGSSAGALSRTIHCYPTQAEVWKRLGDAYARTRLKPWIRRLFERYFAWRR